MTKSNGMRPPRVSAYDTCCYKSCNSRFERSKLLQATAWVRVIHESRCTRNPGTMAPKALACETPHHIAHSGPNAAGKLDTAPTPAAATAYASHLSAAFAIGPPRDVARCCWCSHWPCPQNLDLSHGAVIGISLDVAQALDHVHARAHPTKNGVLACTQHTRGNKMTVVAVVTDAGVCCLGAWLAPKAYIAATSAGPDAYRCRHAPSSHGVGASVTKNCRAGRSGIGTCSYT